jgi:hypothetical protein
MIEEMLNFEQKLLQLNFLFWENKQNIELTYSMQQVLNYNEAVKF